LAYQQAVDFLFNSTGMMPHGYCFLWNPSILWLFTVSNVVTALSYFSIPIALASFAYKRKDIDFRRILSLFSVFISACGITHVLSVVTIWNPVYGLSAIAEALTATASLITAILLWPLIPKALLIPTPSSLMLANKKLEAEISFHKETQEQLRQLNSELDALVKLKTEELQKSETFLRLSQLSGGIGSWEADLINNKQSSSKNYSMILGFSDLIEPTWNDFIGVVHSEDRQKLIDATQRNSESSMNFDVDYRIVTGGGNINWLRSSGIIEYDQESKPILIRGITQDITKRKQTEETCQLLLNSAAEPIYGIDMIGNCTFSNAACLKVLGYKHPEELLGKNMHWQIHGKHADGTFFPIEECSIFQAFQKGVAVHVDDEALWRADGTSFPAEYWSYPQIVNGVTVGAVVSFFDITQRKQNEAVILLAKDQAESLTRSKSEFLANMSHEIRTPMNAIIGLSQLALNKELSVESRDYLEKIYSSSNSLLSILNDILDFSKLEAGRIDIDNLTFNLDVLLDNLSSLFATPAQEKYLDFDIECTPDVPRYLIGDTLRLQQVLVNLLGNAIKFTQQGSVRLNIAVSHQGHSQVRLLFCVTDTGIGMSDKDCEKLFQPFSQVDGSITRRFGGTGLGLAISHNLLQLMGSEISVASSPGKGSCFSFELVFGVSSVKAEKPISELVDSSNLLIGKRVLIAEDNLINQRVVGEFLNLSGITIEIANNGKEALTLLENGEFDVVLMDIHMPEMGGFEATRWIRSQVRFATLPIIALTAGVTKEEQEKCLAIGMNDVIAKPIDPKKLFSTLINWIKPIGSTTNTTDKLLLEQQSGMNDLPTLDLTNLLLMLGNNQKLATRLLLDFRGSMKDVPDELEAMISAGNWVLAREKVHLIRGVSSNVGAVKLHAVTKELEAELKEGASTATFGAFRAAFNQTMSTICALDQPEEPIPSPSGNSFELKRSIVELELLLKENDFISESFLNVFNSYLSTSQLDLFVQLRKLIDELRYGEAQNILQQLATLSNTKDIV